MPSDIDPKLEAFIHERLRQLPPRPAPPTLASRVMASIQTHAAQPWWRQAWGQWPLSARIALVLIALVALGIVSGGNLFLGDGLSACSQYVSDRAAGWSGLWASLAAPATSFAAVWARWVEPYVVPALVVSLALYLVSMGCGTALFRLAWKRA